MTESSHHFFEQLRTAPSVELWRIELQKIFGGERDRVLESLGDAASYVEDVIAQSVERARSRVLFLEVLDEIVFRTDSDDIGIWMIDLIRRYTPRSGFIRIVEMLRRTLPFANDSVADSQVLIGQDLRLRALHALERYYPIPNDPENDAADSDRGVNYGEYIDVLTDNLRYPRYAAYSARLLLSLDVLSPVDERILEVFSVNTEILRTFIRSSLVSNFLPERTLSRIVSMVEELGGGAREVLSDALSEVGGGIKYYDTGVFIHSPSTSSEIVLSFVKPTTVLGDVRMARELEEYTYSDSAIGTLLANGGGGRND